MAGFGCPPRLGDELDQEVANTGTTALAKAHLGIEGRHKGKPSKNPFQYRIMGSEAATTVRLDSPDGTHKVLGEFYKTPAGETRLIAARQLVFKKADGAIVPVINSVLALPGSSTRQQSVISTDVEVNTRPLSRTDAVQFGTAIAAALP